MYLNELKSSYDDVISDVDYLFDQLDLSTEKSNGRSYISMKLPMGCFVEIKLLWSYSLRVSWSAYELFRRR